MYDKPIQHGEVILKPIAKMPKGKTKKVSTFIAAHSRAGHHHVLNAPMVVLETKEHNYVHVTKDGVIVHLKETDKHPDLRLPAGIYQINIKTELDIFDDVIRDVVD